MAHNRGPWSIPVDDPRLDGREMGCAKCGGECTLICYECRGTGAAPFGGVTSFLEGKGGKCSHCGGSGEVPCECQED
jgi:hypothetical protein